MRGGIWLTGRSAADERKAGAELEQEPVELADERVFEIPFSQVPGREAAGGGEGLFQVGGEPVNHAGVPPLRRLAVQDPPAGSPVQTDQLAGEYPPGPLLGVGHIEFDLIQ